MTDPDLAAALAKLEPAIRAAWLAAFALVRDGAHKGLIEAALKRGDVQAAVDLLTFDPTAFAYFDRAITDAYFQGGAITMQGLPKLPTPDIGRSVSIGFDARHPRAEAWARNNVAQRVTEVIADQQQAVREFVTTSLEKGRGPAAITTDLVGRLNRATGKREGGILGLTSHQAGYVANAQAELSNPEVMVNYFTRQRRDKRFDKIVRTAMETGKPVSQADIERITRAYTSRLQALRAETISRTESINALRAGRHEAYLQLVESGKAREDQVIRKWSSAHDSRTRHDHLALDGVTIRGMSQAFVAADGSQMAYPGDRSLGASARQIVACRCTVFYSLDRRRG